MALNTVKGLTIAHYGIPPQLLVVAALIEGSQDIHFWSHHVQVALLQSRVWLLNTHPWYSCHQNIDEDQSSMLVVIFYQLSIISFSAIFYWFNVGPFRTKSIKEVWTFYTLESCNRIRQAECTGKGFSWWNCSMKFLKWRSCRFTATSSIVSQWPSCTEISPDLGLLRCQRLRNAPNL